MDVSSSDEAESRKPLPPAAESNDSETFDHGTNTPSDSSGTSPPPFDLQQVQVGSQLGKYELTGILGRGGMGVVYRAHDTMIERDVAIKILPSELSHNSRSLQRFLGEAKAAGRLDHPNSVRIYDVDQQNGVHFIVMELVEGGNIGDIFKQHGALRVIDATRVLVDACRGIAAAHAVGLVHRDIKPSNLLIGDKTSVKVADFGVAKREDAHTMQLTGEGNLIGTPYFMSPEQCSSEPADARSDVYSLGATYYALLTGQYPYAESQTTMQVMYSHCHTDPPNPRTSNPALPHACSAIVSKAMAKSPGDRYQTAAQMLTDLEKLAGQLTRGDVQPDDEPISTLSAVSSLSAPAAKTKRHASATRVETARKPQKSGGGCVYVALLALLLIAGAVWGMTQFGSLDVAEILPQFATAYRKPTVQLNVVCSLEKQKWLELAANRFRSTREGRKIQVNLVPLESGQAVPRIADGPDETHVWCPAGNMFRPWLEQRLQSQHNIEALPAQAAGHVELVRSPMVFAMWNDRYDKFVDGYREGLTWDTLHKALTESNIWDAIATRNKWGNFKFGYADPRTCDSGVVVLCLMAYHRLQRVDRLTDDDISTPEFEAWYSGLVGKSMPRGKSLPVSDEALLRAVLEHRTGAYDCFMVPESILTNYLHATDRDRNHLKIIYPARNMFQTNPYYELTETHGDAALKFREFLTSVPMQEEAQRLGFRPVNLDVRLEPHEHPFKVYGGTYGLQEEVSQICQPPSLDVVTALVKLHSRARNAEKE